MLKSILKRPPEIQPTGSPTHSPPRSREDRNRETALHHAHLIQARKDTELLILSSTEALLELPSTSLSHPKSAVDPSPSDVSFFKSSLRAFTPSDYDALVTERNINRQCGYTLCPHQNRLENTTAKYRLLRGKGHSPEALRVVERELLERWCSDDCGHRALYVRVQLSEVPAWERRGSSQSAEIRLLDEGQDEHVIKKLTELEIGAGMDNLAERTKALAIERGDGSNNAVRIDVDVHESNEPGNSRASAPAISDRLSSANLIEGYDPSRLTRKTKPDVSMEDDSDEHEDEDIIPTI